MDAFRLMIAFVFAFVFSMPTVDAIPANPEAFNEIQPDGTTVRLYIRGSKGFNYYEDEEGFTILQDRTSRWFHYAKVDLSDKLVQSTLRVGVDRPDVSGLRPGLLPSLESIKKHMPSPSLSLPELEKTKTKFGRPRQGGDGRRLEEMWQITNLVIPMRFSNHKDRKLPPKDDIDMLMNKLSRVDRLNIKVGGVRKVFRDASYDTLDLYSEVVDWIDLPNTEAYYANGKEDEMIENALDILNNDPNFTFAAFDSDGDSLIDAITFLHSGYGAEFGGTSADGAVKDDRIWGSTNYMETWWKSDDGIKVDMYSVSPALWWTSGNDINHIGCIAHQLGYFFGLPNLWGIEAWSLMGNCWGWDSTGQLPPMMSAWEKTKLGFVTPSLITRSGTYSLPESYHDRVVYRIDHGFPAGEYLLIENRQGGVLNGYDREIPQGGIAIWHIDEAARPYYEFSTAGYPGSTGWPENGNHYKIALLQADGKYDLEKGKWSDAGDLFHAGGVAELNGGLNSSLHEIFPNTDSYQGGEVARTGIRIYDISASGNMMTLKVSLVESCICEEEWSAPDYYGCVDQEGCTYCGPPGLASWCQVSNPGCAGDVSEEGGWAYCDMPMSGAEQTRAASVALILVSIAGIVGRYL